MSYFNGKSAVVTGAGSGIGRALATALNRAGCSLYLCDINNEALLETVAGFERHDLSTKHKVLDVANREAMHEWASEIDIEQGYIDIVINNAGVALISTVEDSDYENLDWLMGINFWGVVHGTMAFLPLLRRSKQAHLINISSVFGLIGVPTQSAYNAAKFAVRGYTESLRQELAGSNIHVCCVHPGGIKTNIAYSARGGDTSLTAQQRGHEFQQMARTTPEKAAAKILQAMEKRKKRLLVGLDAFIISLVSRLLPVSYSRLLPKMTEPEASSAK